MVAIYLLSLVFDECEAEGDAEGLRATTCPSILGHSITELGKLKSPDKIKLGEGEERLDNTK